MKNEIKIVVPEDVSVCYEHWYFKMPWMRSYRGMVWGKKIILRTSKQDTPPSLLKHELVHVDQIRRYGVLGFYVRYLWHYFSGLLLRRSHRLAYTEHPFEIEARAAEST